MTADHIDRAADEISGIQVGTGYESVTIGITAALEAARALDAVGLLAKYPRLEIEGDWLVEVVDYHTCGAGPGSGAGHEPGCGSIPVARLATPKHDAEVRADERAKVLAGFTEEHKDICDNCGRSPCYARCRQRMPNPQRRLVGPWEPTP